MIFRALMLAVLWAVTESVVGAVTTNDVATAEREGRELAQQLRNLGPAESFTNRGTLKLRGKSRRGEISFQIHTVATATNWQTIYQATTTNAVANFSVTHHADHANEYRVGDVSEASREAKLSQPFAGSDFTLLDLGLVFFHWPVQNVLKREIKKGQSCDVLESRSNDASPDGYSRIVAWIDRDTGGVVQAEAYDARGKLLKEFDVREFRKVNGEWQVTEVEMRNVQDKTSTLLVFDHGK